MANIIAIVWDFDKTLINGYMQDPMLKAYGIDPKNFWTEVNDLPKKYSEEQHVKVNPDTIYLNHLINYVKDGRLRGLNNAKLREYGGIAYFTNNFVAIVIINFYEFATPNARNIIVNFRASNYFGQS